MKEEDQSVIIARQSRKNYDRVRELEHALKSARETMKIASIESGEICDFVNQGMTQRAAHYAAALQRRLDVERSGGPIL